MPVFPYGTNLRVHNSFIIPNMVNKVITNLNSSEVFGPDCVPVVVLKKCEPELSYILVVLFNMCLKEYCFPDCWTVSSVVHVFKNVMKRPLLETVALFVFFLWLVESLGNLSILGLLIT